MPPSPPACTCGPRLSELNAYLPAAGTYYLETCGNTCNQARTSVSLQSTVWPPALPALEGGGELLHLLHVPDGEQRGVGCFFYSGGSSTDVSFALARMDVDAGTWTPVAGLAGFIHNTINLPTGSLTDCSNYGYDAAGRPVLVNPVPTDVSGTAWRLQVRRYVEGEWRNAGADGLLPQTGGGLGALCTLPSLAVWNGGLLVMHNFDEHLWVLAFDAPGRGWTEAMAGSQTGSLRSTSARTAWWSAPGGRPTIAYPGPGNRTVVKQLEARSGQWRLLGEALWADGMSTEIFNPQIVFDGEDHPRVFGVASGVIAGSTASKAWLWSYDGTRWSSPGPMDPDDNTRQQQLLELSSAYYDGATVAAFNETQNESASFVTRRYDGAWSSLGADRGQVDTLGTPGRILPNRLVVVDGRLHLIAETPFYGQLTVRRYVAPAP